ncbi:hypothetical protein JRI60_00815 [Archangium violaceum]|nr:hypothetical protein [Archangium violaceum]QRN97664.1 hypothetical protein JRI60_00815 [Archangium violaceum]
MSIDPTRARGTNIVRPWGWTLALVVSEDLKEAIEREGLTGTRITVA